MERRNIGQYSDWWLLRTTTHGAIIMGGDPRQAIAHAAGIGIPFQRERTWAIPLPYGFMNGVRGRDVNRRLSLDECADLECRMEDDLPLTCGDEDGGDPNPYRGSRAAFAHVLAGAWRALVGALHIRRV